MRLYGRPIFERKQRHRKNGPHAMTAKEKAKSHGNGHNWWRPALLVAALLLIVVLARIFGIGERLGALRSWIEGLGSWGPVAFFFLYAAAVVAAIPGSAPTLVAGARPPSPLPGW